MFAREGYSTIFITLVFACVVSLAAYYLDNWFSFVLYAAMLLLVAFILFFFRDPDRETPPNENLIISPADGKVVLIKQVKEEEYIGGSATQISIFLSPLDVHVNRVPAGGKLEYLEYHPGAYHMAWDHRASTLNERADFGVRHPSGCKIFFRQITGFMARRIVYHIKKGQNLTTGQRFGMMKFGSRMDILIPEGIEVAVSEGETTVGGETILSYIEKT